MIYGDAPNQNNTHTFAYADARSAEGIINGKYCNFFSNPL
jgi:hypothetical protein